MIGVNANGSNPVTAYEDPLPYVAASLGIALLGIGIALSTTKLTVIIAGSIIALMGVSIFDQIVAYDAAHPQGSKNNPKLRNYMIYGVGGGIVKTILIVTAVTIKLLVII